jgi:hypothetical protein
MGGGKEGRKWVREGRRDGGTRIKRRMTGRGTRREDERVKKREREDKNKNRKSNKNKKKEM